MNELPSNLAVSVPAECAQHFRQVLEDNGIWDCGRKLQRNGKSVAIPILGVCSSKLETFLQDYPAAQITELSLPPSAKSTRRTEAQKLKEETCNLLWNKNLSLGLLSELPKKWERHGDLIILPSSAFTSPQWNQLGEELWPTVASALSCSRLARHSAVANDGFRTPQVSMLLGHDGKVVHVDNGIKYSFDVTKCMFSSGNITEKLRVASWDCSNEVVVDLYAGIGYFTLPYLVHAKALHVHACEWNPDAIEALKAGLSLNGVADRCTVHQGDNRQLKLSCVADRVNLGLIPSSEDGWRVAAQVLKSSGGVLHIHHNVSISPSSNTNFHQSRYAREGCERSVMVKNDESFLYNDSERENTNTKRDGLLNPTGTDLTSASGPHDLSEKNDSSDYFLQKENSPDIDCAAAVDLDRIRKRYLPWARQVCEKIKGLLVYKKEEGEGVGSGSRRRWQCEIVHIEKVKSYAPHIDHVVLDMACRPRDDDR